MGIKLYYLTANTMSDIFQNLNDQQKEAVIQIEGPLLVLAPLHLGSFRVLRSRKRIFITRDCAL